MDDEHSWSRDAEALVYGVQRLLDERDAIAHQLAQALGDLDLANTRIDQLSHLNHLLLAELTRTKGKTSKAFAGWIASGIAGVLLGLGAGFVSGIGEGVGGEVYRHWTVAQERAQHVAEACGYDVAVNFNINAPPMPATSTTGQGAKRSERPPLQAEAQLSGPPAVATRGETVLPSIAVQGSIATENATAMPGTISLSATLPKPSIGGDARREVADPLGLSDEIDTDLQHGEYDNENIGGENHRSDDGPDVLNT